MRRHGSCLEKDEAAARAALVPEVLPPLVDDDDDEDDRDWTDDAAIPDAFDDIPPLFDLDGITRVTYAHALAPSLVDFRRGTGGVCSMCIEMGARDEAPACRRHASGTHACGESETFRPITNSPRNGVCGYGLDWDVGG